MKLFSITGLLLVAFFANGYAQKNKPVLHLQFIANSISYDGKKLYGEVAKTKSLSEAQTLVRKRVTATSGSIMITMKSNGHKYWWRKVYGVGGHEKEGEFIITGRRDASGNTVYKKEDFGLILQDTLFVFDSLAITVLINNKSLSLYSYGYKYKCPAVTTWHEAALPIQYRNQLIVRSGMLATCNNSYTLFELTNKTATKNPVGSCYLLFANTTMKDEIRSVARYLRSNKYTPKQVATLVSGYVQQNFGAIAYEPLFYWLQKNP